MFQNHLANLLPLFLIVLPALAIPAVLLAENASRKIALAVSFVGVVLAGALYFQFDSHAAEGMQMRLSVDWFSQFGIQFALGVDGLSLPLVLLSKLVLPLALFACGSETRRRGLMMACFLAADAIVTTCFLATDIFLFYSCYELVLIPLLLIIGIWGGTERIYAAVKFFLFTAAGSFLMLAAILWIFNAYQTQFGAYSADLTSLSHLNWSSEPVLFGLRPEVLCLAAFLIAFAVKIPAFPFHAWLPTAYGEAPIGGTLYLSAVLSKLGIYGLLRVAAALCPGAFGEFSNVILIVGVVGCLYAAAVAFYQTNLKMLLAYSSFSHLNLILVGVASTTVNGWNGVILHLFNHGVTSGTLFLLASMLYDRRQSYALADFGGLAQRMPRYAFFLSLAAFSSMALPGLNGFAGELLILLGAFQAHPVLAAIATMSVVLTAVYLLRMIQSTLLGEFASGNRAIKDISVGDCIVLGCAALFLVGLGVQPGILTKKIEPFPVSQKVLESPTRPN